LARWSLEAGQRALNNEQACVCSLHSGGLHGLLVPQPAQQCMLRADQSCCPVTCLARDWLRMYRSEGWILGGNCSFAQDTRVLGLALVDGMSQLSAQAHLSMTGTQKTKRHECCRAFALNARWMRRQACGWRTHSIPLGLTLPCCRTGAAACDCMIECKG
jgi:hypothetical protein